MAILCTLWLMAGAQQAPDAAGVTRKTGTVKSVRGNEVVLRDDAGQEIKVTIQDNARILRVEPGQTNLKSAVPMTAAEIQSGDRMLVRGQPGDSANSVQASAVIVMRQSDVAEKQQHERMEWQRHGTGGIVTAVDSSAGTVNLSVTPTQTVVVKTTRDTGFLRYAPNSVKFEDARKSSFADIKVGDQLRARGTRSSDGKELTADEVISGTFRNIAGTITAIHPEASSITVKDVLSKKSVAVKLTGDSEMRNLPEPLARRIAFFLKSPEAAQAAAARFRQRGGGEFARGGAGGAGGARAGGSPDFQQMINRLPAVTLSGLKKDEAVMIVSTPGTGNSEVTAITLLSGVEPILTSNTSEAAALLNGWNLSAPAEDAGPQ
ncbi:MAG TPA: hypothetical protein VFP59_17475 [Candidatus Angelobacter sp.]|nr:hypothetical protein [Candidatus Angelobacter sp.]